MSSAPVLLAASAIGLQIAYPLVSGSARDLVTVAIVVLLAAASVTHALAFRGRSWALALVVITVGFGLCAEVVGTATGFPFGSYSYAPGRLGPEILGVPAVVPLAWTAGFYPIFCSATRLTASMTSRRRTPVLIVATAVGMVGWDLYLDPQMVSAGLWNWADRSGGLPGLDAIPFTNYVGWFAISAIMAAAMTTPTLGGSRTPQSPRVDAVPIALFMWTWLGSAVAHAFFLPANELRYSALYGLAAMGVLGIPLLGVLASTALRRRHVHAGSTRY